MQSLYPNVRIEFVKFPEELKGKYQTFTQANLDKLRSVGYTKEFTPIEIGIKKYVEILNSTGGVLIG